MSATPHGALEAALGLVRDVLDFPEPGVLFKDITPLLAQPGALSTVVAALVGGYADQAVDAVAGMEARGFIFGAPVAMALGCGFVPVRKPGKLPWRTRSVDYDLEYGSETLEVHVDAFGEGARVLVVDDVLATGGTARATVDLVRQSGAEVVGVAVVLELSFLAGRALLDDVPLTALLTV